jgi:hypothetical protein
MAKSKSNSVLSASYSRGENARHSQLTGAVRGHQVVSLGRACKRRQVRMEELLVFADDALPSELKCQLLAAHSIEWPGS